MNVDLPASYESTPGLAVFRRQLAVRSLPFLAVALIGQVIAFEPSRTGSIEDAYVALALLSLSVGMFLLPQRFLDGNANVLIPLSAAISAIFVVHASGMTGFGTSLLLFAPVCWTALFLKRWKSYLVLATTILSQYLTLLVTHDLTGVERARWLLFSCTFGLVIVFSVQDLRHRILRAQLESESAHAVMRSALDEVSRRDHVLTNISQGIDITDPRLPESPTIFVSPSFQRLSGYDTDELKEHGVALLFGPATDPTAIEELRRCATVGEDCTVEILNYRKDGSTFWNARSVSAIRDDEGQVVNLVSVNTDVTKRRELEERLMQSQKMEVVGTLSAGMAHDFNNSLLVIRGYNSLIAKATKEPQVQALSQKVDDAVHQASEVTHRLLAYSRFHESHPSVTDVNALLANTLTLWGRLLGDQIVCNLDLAENLMPVMIDRGHLEQAIVNLITNGRDAMPRGGVLTIRSSLREVRAETFSPKSHLRPGSYVEIEVRDSGVGIDDETRARIFEPFYTTKTHGTGLGLPTVENVIRQSGGGVEVRSELGRGTSFLLTLPASPLLTIGEPLEAFDDPHLGDGETVLIVEDLDPARELLVQALSDHGFRVLAASDGVAALAVVAKHEGPLPLLVTDVDMPEMGGPELARRLLVTHPDLRVVFVSGYPVNDLVFESDFLHRAAFVAKPYKLNELLREMRRIVV